MDPTTCYPGVSCDNTVRAFHHRPCAPASDTTVTAVVSPERLPIGLQQLTLPLPGITSGGELYLWSVPDRHAGECIRAARLPSAHCVVQHFERRVVCFAPFRPSKCTRMQMTDDDWSGELMNGLCDTQAVATRTPTASTPPPGRFAVRMTERADDAALTARSPASAHPLLLCLIPPGPHTCCRDVLQGIHRNWRHGLRRHGRLPQPPVPGQLELAVRAERAVL